MSQDRSTRGLHSAASVRAAEHCMSRLFRSHWFELQRPRSIALIRILSAALQRSRPAMRLCFTAVFSRVFHCVYRM